MTDHVRERVAAAVGDQYDVEAEIGRGGMSIVYRALDRRLRRHIAIKVLPPEFAFDPAVRERFRREAQTAAQLNHPNIIPIHSVDERDGVAFFAMSLCEGSSLAALLARSPRPPLDDVRRVICEVADALAYAHTRGVVHRDIKPDNILLDRDTGRAMVSDFGIARAAEAGTRLTVTGIAVGTPAYMSPEQALGEHQIDGRSDIYSLGVVGYQMLVGVTPFVASNTPAMLMKHVSEAPLPIATHRRDVPPDLGAAIERALAKRPEDRWQSATELRDILSGRHVPAFAGSHRVVPRPDAARQVAPIPGGTRGRDRGRRARRDEERARARERSAVDNRSEDELSIVDRLHQVRHRLVSYTGVTGILFAINFATEGPAWFLIPTAVMSADILRRFGGLWADGIPMRYVFRRPRRYDPVLAGVDMDYGLGPQAAMFGYDDRSRAGRGAAATGGLAEMNREGATAPGAGYPAGQGLGGDGVLAARAPSQREIRDQMRAAAQARADLEDDRHIWGRAASLERRFRRFRRQTLIAASSAGLTTGLALLTVASQGDAAPLFFASLVPLAITSVSWVRKALSLRRDEVDITEVLTKPIDNLVRAYDPAALIGQVAQQAPPGMASSTSPHMEAVRRAVADRTAILDAVRRMPKADRRMLPDIVPTVNALVERIASLAPTIARLDADLQPNALARLEERIAESERQPQSAEGERKLALLRRQQASLQDLVRRREMLVAQLDSAGILLQNLRLDLIKVRSAGIHSSAQGVNNATQEARALSREIGYVLGAAEDVKEL